MTHLLNENNIKDFAHGVNIIKQGGTVAFRTETVYGLGADATSDDAIKKIFIAKNRPQSNPLIIHFHSLEHLQQYINVPQELVPLFKIKHALTVVLEKPEASDNKPELSQVALGGQNTVACRIPSCPFARKFIKDCGLPIAAPSANTSTRPSPTRWQDVYDDLNRRIDAIFTGAQTNIGLESTVILYNNGILEVLRQGGINIKKLSRLSKMPVKLVTKESEKLHKSPGTRFKHYSPSAPLQIITKLPAVEFLENKHAIILCRTQNKKLYNHLLSSLPDTVRIITLGKNAKQVQTNLFAAFREAEKLLETLCFDAKQFTKSSQLILIESMPKTQDFSSVNERISKASQT